MDSIHFEDSNKSGTRDKPNPNKILKLHSLTDHTKTNTLKLLRPKQNL